MSRSTAKQREITRKDYERITYRYWKRVEPYFERLQVEWILMDLDRQREALKDPSRWGMWVEDPAKRRREGG